MHGLKTKDSCATFWKCLITSLILLLIMLPMKSLAQNSQLTVNGRLVLEPLDFTHIYKEELCPLNPLLRNPRTLGCLSISEKDLMKQIENWEKSAGKRLTQKELDSGVVILWRSRQTPQAQLSWEIPLPQLNRGERTLIGKIRLVVPF